METGTPVSIEKKKHVVAETEVVSYALNTLWIK